MAREKNYCERTVLFGQRQHIADYPFTTRDILKAHRERRRGSQIEHYTLLLTLIFLIPNLRLPELNLITFRINNPRKYAILMVLRTVDNLHIS